MNWQPIETAPKDGTVFLAYWNDVPQFVAWCGEVAGKTRRVGHLWWRRVIVEETDRHGFRVLMPPARGMGWCIHGNFAPFTPKFWMPLPPPPETTNEG